MQHCVLCELLGFYRCAICKKLLGSWHKLPTQCTGAFLSAAWRARCTYPAIRLSPPAILTAAFLLKACRHRFKAHGKAFCNAEEAAEGKRISKGQCHWMESVKGVCSNVALAARQKVGHANLRCTF